MYVCTHVFVYVYAYTCVRNCIMYVICLSIYSLYVYKLLFMIIIQASLPKYRIKTATTSDVYSHLPYLHK